MVLRSSSRPPPSRRTASTLCQMSRDRYRAKASGATSRNSFSFFGPFFFRVSLMGSSRLPPLLHLHHCLDCPAVRAHEQQIRPTPEKGLHHPHLGLNGRERPLVDVLLASLESAHHLVLDHDLIREGRL